MKRFRTICFLLLLSSVATEAFPQFGLAGAAGSAGSSPLELDGNYRVKTVYFMEYVVENGDTIPVYRFSPIPVYSKRLFDEEKDWRLIRNVKRVYPIAKYANDKLQEMEKTLATMHGNKRAQERYVKEVEKELKEQYTPIIKKLSFSQGKILIKLIDRQTGQTSYELVKEMRGNFTAFFWQNLGRLFGMNLKDKYDAEGDDKQIEQIIRYVETGLL